MFLLAVSDGWVIGMFLTNVLASVLLGLGLYLLNTKARRYESLEETLHSTTTKLIDERFRAMTHELNSHVQGFVLALDDMKGRVKDSEAGFSKLGESDHAIELKVVQRMDQIKDYVRDYTASKEQVRSLEQNVSQRVERLSERVAVLGEQVAVLAHQAEAQ